VLFYHAGGVDVGDVDAKAARLLVPIGDGLSAARVAASGLLEHVPASRQPLLASFVASLFALYYDAQFCYLEINPLVVTGDEGGGSARIVPLDLAAKLDEAGAFLAAGKWGADLAFPPDWGRKALPEEAYIREMDGKTGASLKLTVLNRAGRVWTMVAGGGASVTLTICFSALLPAAELCGSASFSFAVALSPLHASLAGGGGVVGDTAHVNFDASASADPDGLSGALSFSWACVATDGVSACLSASGAPLQLQPGAAKQQLRFLGSQAGRGYTVSVSVSKRACACV
jgi:hypothetical protein